MMYTMLKMALLLALWFWGVGALALFVYLQQHEYRKFERMRRDGSVIVYCGFWYIVIPFRIGEYFHDHSEDIGKKSNS